jgi:hypothetical protein
MLFRSWQRGTREVGLLLGSFAEGFLAVLDGAPPSPDVTPTQGIALSGTIPEL